MRLLSKNVAIAWLIYAIVSRYTRTLEFQFQLWFKES
jgi:hypothetical protein